MKKENFKVDTFGFTTPRFGVIKSNITLDVGKDEYNRVYDALSKEIPEIVKRVLKNQKVEKVPHRFYYMETSEGMKAVILKNEDGKHISSHLFALILGTNMVFQKGFFCQDNDVRFFRSANAKEIKKLKDAVKESYQIEL